MNTYTLDFKDTSLTGLSLSFSYFKKVSDNTNVISPVIVELGNGVYKFDFLPTDDIYFHVTDGTNEIYGRIDKNNINLFSEKLSRALGLMQENFYLDNVVYSSGVMVSGRIRIYDSAVNVGTGAGVVATYTITSTEAAGVLQTYKVTL